MKKDKKERVQKNRKSQEANVKRAKAQGYARMSMMMMMTMTIQLLWL